MEYKIQGKSAEIKELSPGHYEITLNGHKKEVKVLGDGHNLFNFHLENRSYEVLSLVENSHVNILLKSGNFDLEIYNPREKALDEIGGKSSGGTGTVKSNMPGKVISVLKKEGDLVESGEVILILEAMKMENEISSEASGKIEQIKVKKGDQVAAGTFLFKVGN